jgi:hypothetical protein
MNSSTPYRIKVDPDAWKYIKTPVPGAVREQLRDILHEFAASPAKLSKPSRFPFVPGEQCFECSIVHPPNKYFFHVIFKYSADETTIHIARFGLRVFELPPDQQWFPYMD